MLLSHLVPPAWQGPGQCTPWQHTQEGTCPLLPTPLQEHPAPDLWGWVIKMEFCLPAPCDSSHRRGVSATPVDDFSLPAADAKPTRAWAVCPASIPTVPGLGTSSCCYSSQQQCPPHLHTPVHTFQNVGRKKRGISANLWWRVLGGGIILECHCHSAKAHFWQKIIGAVP